MIVVMQSLREMGRRAIRRFTRCLYMSDPLKGTQSSLFLQSDDDEPSLSPPPRPHDAPKTNTFYAEFEETEADRDLDSMLHSFLHSLQISVHQNIECLRDMFDAMHNPHRYRDASPPYSDSDSFSSTPILNEDDTLPDAPKQPAASTSTAPSAPPTSAPPPHTSSTHSSTTAPVSTFYANASDETIDRYRVTVDKMLACLGRSDWKDIVDVPVRSVRHPEVSMRPDIIQLRSQTYAQQYRRLSLVRTIIICMFYHDNHSDIRYITRTKTCDMDLPGGLFARILRRS